MGNCGRGKGEGGRGRRSRRGVAVIAWLLDLEEWVWCVCGGVFHRLFAD